MKNDKDSLRLILTIEEMVESISLAIDDPRIPASVIDRVMNITCGITEYLRCRRESLLSAPDLLESDSADLSQ